MLTSKLIAVQIRMTEADIKSIDQMRREADDLPSRAELCARIIHEAIIKAAKKRESK